MTHIRIITQDNGVGLTRDADILHAAMAGGSLQLSHHRFKTNKLYKWIQRLAILCSTRKTSANIFLERLHPSVFARAKRNILIPNPEWTLPKWLPHLSKLDAVWVKTRHAEKIFSALGCNTQYIGFSSEDRFLPTISKSRDFFHLAGKSRHKGTQSLIALWQQNPHWPLLTIVQHPSKITSNASCHNIQHIARYLDDTELRILQNQHRFHLCVSETEGFGHYLVEAMSTQAVVLSTDAPPMNELVNEERGLLVAYEKTTQQNLATCYQACPEQLKLKIEQAFAMSEAQTETLGIAAREFFLKNDAEFKARVKQFAETIC